MQPSDSTSPFLRKVREAIRVRHLSIRTEEAYVGWIKRFIVFYGKRHPMELAQPRLPVGLALCCGGNLVNRQVGADEFVFRFHADTDDEL